MSGLISLLDIYPDETNDHDDYPIFDENVTYRFGRYIPLTVAVAKKMVARKYLCVKGQCWNSASSLECLRDINVRLDIDGKWKFYCKTKYGSWSFFTYCDPKKTPDDMNYFGCDSGSSRIYIVVKALPWVKWKFFDSSPEVHEFGNSQSIREELCCQTATKKEIIVLIVYWIDSKVIIETLLKMMNIKLNMGVRLELMPGFEVTARGFVTKLVLDHLTNVSTKETIALMFWDIIGGRADEKGFITKHVQIMCMNVLKHLLELKNDHNSLFSWLPRDMIRMIHQNVVY